MLQIAMTETQEIIDCHIHPAVSKDTDVSWFIPMGDAAIQFEALRRAGISRACGAPVLSMTPASFAPIRALNDGALALRDRFPDFYVPGIHIHPRFPHESCAEIARCCGGEGVRWIGELVGYLMGYGEEYATPDALAVFAEAERHRAVVNLHCGDLDVLETLCRARPGLRVVLAHPGSDRKTVKARTALVARLPNLHLDISGSGIDRYGILRLAIDTAGKDKLLFGTDFPINNPAVYVHGSTFEPLTGPERAALYQDNFLRLCGD